VAIPPPNRDWVFRRGLRDLGYIEYIEVKNIQVEYRYVEGKPDWGPEHRKRGSCNSRSIFLLL
jgi:hypothetical protein